MDRAPDPASEATIARVFRNLVAADSKVPCDSASRRTHKNFSLSGWRGWNHAFDVKSSTQLWCRISVSTEN